MLCSLTLGKDAASVWSSRLIVWLYSNIKVTYMQLKAEQSLSPDFISRERFRVKARGSQRCEEEQSLS